MEDQTEHIADKYDQFHIRVPAELLNWYRQRAKIQRRSIRAEIELAMVAYQNSVEISVSDAKRLLEE